jgi:hypothetical protein
MARPSSTLSDPGLLEAALEGLLLQRDRIESQIREVRALLGRKRVGRPAAPQPQAGGGTKTKRQLSEAARRRIAAAQKKRWAEYRKQAKNQ